MRNLARLTCRSLSGYCLLAALAFAAHAQPLTFTTLAGPAGGPGSADGTASAARFGYSFGIATAAGGNVYMTDTDNHTIRKINAAGAVTTLAGSTGLSGSADGTGAAARFDNPRGVAIDSGGNVYVADLLNRTIRKITPAGVVTTFAGLADRSGSTDGTGSAARFSGPQGLAIDSAGNLYVADAFNNTIRKITPAGVVTTLAGSPTNSSGSADGTGSAARFKGPFAVATDSGGNVYVADTSNYTIRKITPAGVVTTLAGSAGLSGKDDGFGSAARFSFPEGVAVDSAGNVYVADSDNNIIRKITPAGAVTTLAGSAGINGSADGTGSAARFSFPQGLATDSAGNVYVADVDVIRKISPEGVASTLAGSSSPFGSTDGTGTAARFASPGGVATDSNRNVYVADGRNYTVRKITPAGVVTTLAGAVDLPGSVDGTGSAARFRGPAGVATDSAGNVYVADQGNDTIRKITQAGVVTTLAGSATDPAGSADGNGSFARFNGPAGVATDSNGNLYVADSVNKTIRKITSAGEVTTLAGSAGLSGDTDGTGSAARFNNPMGVAVDSDGNVYVTDPTNFNIRKVTPGGVVTTLTESVGLPTGVATDSGGNVYVADLFGETIKKITPAGVVTTLAGSAGRSGTEDGTGSAARFYSPPGLFVIGLVDGLATDSLGNVYLADSFNNKIRIGRPALSDTAAIDFPTGSVFTTRQLSTSTQTATSWQWTLIRQPAASAAQLSSTSTRNPVFIPDVADLYIFQLTASDGAKTSITTVSLTATPPPRRRAVGR